MPITCPACGSDRTQSCPAAHSAGVSSFASRSTPMGLGTTVTTEGLAMTGLATQCAPPEPALTFRAGCGILVIGWAVLFLVMLVTGGLAGKQQSDAVGWLEMLCLIASVAFAVWLTCRGIRYNANVLPGLLKTWQRTWICTA